MTLAILIAILCLWSQNTNANGPPADLGNQHGLGLVEGDIMAPGDSRSGVLTAKKWPTTKIPFEFSTDFESEPLEQWQKDMVWNAIREIEKHSCIRFVQRTTEPDYVKIVKGPQCWSYIGKKPGGGIQYISLSDKETDCWEHYIVVHELFHTIGLFHEHARHDRDKHITVNWQNVKPGEEYNFHTRITNESSSYDIDYNYWSVMHYAKTAFSKGGNAVAITTPDDYITNYVIGKQIKGHELDYEKIRRMYSCTGTFPEMPPPADSICKDNLTYCNDLKVHCRKVEALWRDCRLTCGFCKPDTCKDTYKQCYSKRHECNQAWAKDQCKKTCKYCSS